MRADAPVLVAGVASFPRVEAEKDPELYARWESLTIAYLQGKYGDNLRAVVMHNDEEQPHLHFFVCSDTEVNAKALHYGHKAKKEFHSSIQGVPRRLSRPSRDPLRNGPPRAKEAAPDTRRVEGTKEHAMKVAAAESAVLDSAATKEKEAHKRLQAVQEHAELLAKEKRATREAMQKALALQAEAREKIAQSEALLAQYGLADVAPQPTPAPEASKAAPIGEFGL